MIHWKAASLLLLFAISAHAQSYLESQLAIARRESRAFAGRMSQESPKAGTLDVCSARLARFKLDHFEWVTSHANDLRALDRELLALRKTSLFKLKKLETSDFRVNPVKGQKSREIAVTLPQMIAFYRIYNERLRSTRAEQLTDLVQIQEDPSLNRAGLSYSQVNAATEQMVTAMNSSLAQTDNVFSIQFRRREKDYAIEFVIDTVLSGTKTQLRLPLLSGASESLSDAHFWRALLNASRRPTVADRPLDGFERLRAEWSRFEGNCRLLGSDDLEFSDLSLPKSLFVDFALIDRQARKLIEASQQGQGVVAKPAAGLNVVFYPGFSGKTCNGDGYLLTVNGTLWDQESCYWNRAATLDFHGMGYVFVLGYYRTINVFNQAGNPVNIPGVNDAFAIIEAGTVNDRPVVTYLTSHYGIHTVDLGGNRIYTRPPTPAKTLVNDTTGLELLSKLADGTYCNSGSLVFLNQVDWSLNYCYRQAFRTYLWGATWMVLLDTAGNLFYTMDPQNRVRIPNIRNVRQVLSLAMAGRRLAVKVLDENGQTRTIAVDGREVH